MEIRRRRSARLVALAALIALVIGACAAESELSRDPYSVDRALPEVDVSEMRLPTAFTDFRIVDPGWETEPQYAEGMYLAAGEREGFLEFTAIDRHGEVLWAAQRPANCTGFALTADSQGRVLAVLTDTETTSDALAGTTASAYVLSSGEQVWGPMEVPGPHHGPGLVFAAAPEEAMGDTGPRTALDPDTGRTAVAETGDQEERVVGEFHGIVLLAAPDALIARDAGDDRELWRLPLDEYNWDASAISVPAEAPSLNGMALLHVGESTEELIDLRGGAVLHHDVRDAVLDPTSDTLVVLDEAGLHAYDAERALMWQIGAGPETAIAAAGGVLLYLRDGDSVRVHNVVTGAVAEAYDPSGEGPILVPDHFSLTGAGLLLDGGRHLLATIPEAPIMEGDSAP